MWEVRERLACHEACGDGGDGAVCRFGDEWHGARGAWVHLDQVDFVVFDRELYVHQADDVDCQGECLGLHADAGDDVVGERVGWQGTSRVA